MVVTTTTGHEHVWQAGWQLGGCFCHGAGLPSSYKTGKKPQTLLYSDHSTGQKMTGQSQTKAGQGNLVLLGVENGLSSFKRVTNPKSAFFQRHHSSSDSKAQAVKSSMAPQTVHTKSAAGQHVKKKTTQIVSQSVLHYLLLTHF